MSYIKIAFWCGYLKLNKGEDAYTCVAVAEQDATAIMHEIVILPPSLLLPFTSRANPFFGPDRFRAVSDILSFVPVIINQLCYKRLYTYSKWLYLIYNSCQLTVFSSDVCMYDLRQDQRPMIRDIEQKRDRSTRRYYRIPPISSFGLSSTIRRMR